MNTNYHQVAPPNKTVANNIVTNVAETAAAESVANVLQEGPMPVAEAIINKAATNAAKNAVSNIPKNVVANLPKTEVTKATNKGIGNVMKTAMANAPVLPTNVPKNVSKNIVVEVAQNAANVAVANAVTKANVTLPVAMKVAEKAAMNAVNALPKNVKGNVPKVEVAKVANNAAKVAVNNASSAMPPAMPKNIAKKVSTEVVSEVAQVAVMNAVNNMKPSVPPSTAVKTAKNAAIKAIGTLPVEIKENVTKTEVAKVANATAKAVVKMNATNAKETAIVKQNAVNVKSVVKNATAVLNDLKNAPKNVATNNMMAVNNMANANDAIIEMNNKVAANKPVTNGLVNKVEKELTKAVNTLEVSKKTPDVNAKTNNVIKNAINIAKEVKKSVKKMFTTQGNLVNVQQNNKGKFRMQNNNKVYVTESIKPRNRLAPVKNDRKLTKSQHFTTQGDLKNVFENKNGRRYVVKKSDYAKNLHNKKGRVAQGNTKETVHYPFGTSKFINSNDLLI